jgi:hypothetical protein
MNPARRSMAAPLFLFLKNSESTDMIKACGFDACGTLFNRDVPHAPLKAALPERAPAPALLDL